MSAMSPRGRVYRCPICGAEITVLAHQVGDDFKPRCCNRPMMREQRQVVFYRCPVCGAEIGALRPHGPDFNPRCCNRDMIMEEAA